MKVGFQMVLVPDSLSHWLQLHRHRYLLGIFFFGLLRISSRHMKGCLLPLIYMLLFHSPELIVLPVLRYLTGVALFVFWCCLVKDLLISVCWFSLVAFFCVVVWVSRKISDLLWVTSLRDMSVIRQLFWLWVVESEVVYAVVDSVVVESSKSSGNKISTSSIFWWVVKSVVSSVIILLVIPGVVLVCCLVVLQRTDSVRDVVLLLF